MIRLACRLDATAPKAGNVHFGRSFDDLDAGTFLKAADAIASPLANASSIGVGSAVLRAVRAMEEAVGTNTHLGTILLIAPLAAADPLSRAGVEQVLEQLTATDARAVYEAIRLARPGGLGTVESMDVDRSPPACLLDAMRAAAPRDSVAAQYANGFRDMWEVVVPGLAPVPVLLEEGDWLGALDAIVRAHIGLIAQFGDTLILRKCGERLFREARSRAQAVCDMANRRGEAYITSLPEFQDFDTWLRADGNRRNPGTTADLITAGLYAVLRISTATEQP